jgi:EAL domain-containing protein (putative c-di-GMP-specific phosphodiesterase class I)
LKEKSLEDAKDIIETILKICNRANVEIVAEFVENEKVLNILKSL